MTISPTEFDPPAGPGWPCEDPPRMEVLEALYGRQSVVCTGPTPCRASDRDAAGRGRASPNHYHERPWRFIVYTGDGRRQLGEAIAAVGPPVLPGEHRARARRRAAEAAQVARGHRRGVDQPRHQYLHEIDNICAVACATQNLLLAAHALGLASALEGRWRKIMTRNSSASLAYTDEHRLLALLYIGYPLAPLHIPPRPVLKTARFGLSRPASEVSMSASLKLMIPGPVQPDDDVLAQMGQPVQAHYGPAWTELYRDTTRALAQVFGTTGDVHVLVGSGSAGLDACLGSAAAAGQTVIIGVNGFFGQRLQAIAESYGLSVVPVTAPWGQPLDPAAFEIALNQHPATALVAVVHVETSTTIVNPIQAIGEIVRAHNNYYLVDAVSSLGGVPLNMDAWHIDLCVSASQKCLGAPPGLAPVAVGPRGWEAIDRVPAKGHGWYLNLRVWRQYAQDWGDWHPYPITLATNIVLALRASLGHSLAEGLDQRWARFRQLAVRLRHGLRSIGLEPFTSDALLNPVVTAAYGPPGVPTSRLIAYMAEQHGIKIAGGMGQIGKTGSSASGTWPPAPPWPTWMIWWRS